MSFQLVELGSIANFINGFAFKPSHWEESGKPIIRIQNLTNPSKPFNYSSMEVPEKYHVTCGDLLVSWSATLDVFEWEREDALLNQHIFKIEPNYEKVNKDYLRYALRDAISAMLKFTRGSTMKHVNRGDFLGTKIPLPPLDTQKKIAAVLEKADQLRKDCQQMEQELNSLAQSVFIDMFGDQLASPHYSLGDVSSVVSGVTKGQKHTNKIIVKAPYMRVANVQAGYLNLNEIKEIEVKDSDVEKYKLEVGDVLLTEGGDHDKLGRGAIWNGEVENCIHQNHVFRVRLDNSLYTSEWLNGYLKTTFAKRYFLKCAKKTTNLASINITQLKGLPMPKVDIAAQEKFERILSIINQQTITNKKIQEEHNQSFDALMQKAFKGELNL